VWVECGGDGVCRKEGTTYYWFHLVASEGHSGQGIHNHQRMSMVRGQAKKIRAPHERKDKIQQGWKRAVTPQNQLLVSFAKAGNHMVFFQPREKIKSGALFAIFPSFLSLQDVPGVGKGE